MRWFGQTLALVAWSCWLGGIVCLFITLQTLFQTQPRETFVLVAPPIILSFERYVLLLAGLALVGTFLWRLAGPTRGINGVFTLLAIAAVAAVISTTFITPRLEMLRQNDLTQTPQFKKLHGISMAVYCAQALLLLAAGAVLPIAMRSNGSPPQTAPDTVPAKDSPV